MHRVALLVLLLALAAPAWADPIRVIDGALTVTPGAAALTMTGDTRAFTWTSQMHPSYGVFRPAWDPRLPGEAVDLEAYWLGLDIRNGRATLDETTYTRIGGLNADDPPGSVRFVGQAGTLPDTGPTAILIAPFQFEGQFAQELLIGSGFATLTYARDGLNLWAFTSASYQFAGPEPVGISTTPDPATLLLVGSGLAAGVWRRRRA